MALSECWVIPLVWLNPLGICHRTLPWSGNSLWKEPLNISVGYLAWQTKRSKKDSNSFRSFWTCLRLTSLLKISGLLARSIVCGPWPFVQYFVIWSSYSGGQQRRVSLAVVLVHDPQLLILDEPTVGLDPVLRQKIWDYLVQIADEKKTIIITTHYIEEANQAHNVRRAHLK